MEPTLLSLGPFVEPALRSLGPFVEPALLSLGPFVEPASSSLLLQVKAMPNAQMDHLRRAKG